MNKNRYSMFKTEQLINTMTDNNQTIADAYALIERLTRENDEMRSLLVDRFNAKATEVRA